MDGALSQPLPPGGAIEIVFSFDTTGSMSECLDHVRGQLGQVIERLFADIPGLRISVFAHGDYCDLDCYGYVTKYVDFTNDVAQLCNFVAKVEGTGGGDFEECYELVLRQVREQLSWTPGTQRALVMIGDATPHQADAIQNRDQIDWREESRRLVEEQGVHIYGVQCLDNREADSFYRHLAESTGGRHLKLDQLNSIVDMMMAICYREHGVEFFEAYEKEIRGRDLGGMQADIGRMFDALRDRELPGDTGEIMSEADDNQTDTDTPGGATDGLSVDDMASTLDTPPATPSSAKTTTVSSPRPKLVRLRNRKRSGSESSTTSGQSTSSHRTSRRSSVRTRSMVHPMKLRKRPKRLDTLTPRKNKQVVLPRRGTTEKALREEIGSGRFALADLHWSDWKQALAKTAPARGSWESRQGQQVGMRNAQLFENMTDAAIYELAVQPPASRSKIPVLNKVTIGYGDRRHWEAALLSQPKVQTRVNHVLRRGCKLYVRRALVTLNDMAVVRAKTGRIRSPSKDSPSSITELVRELRSLAGQLYDYAWTDHYDVTTRKYSHRTIHRNTCRI